jgi:hypothetical protein
MITKTFASIRDAYGCGVSCPICGVPLFTSLAKKYNWKSNTYNDLNMFLGGYELYQNIKVDTLGPDTELIFNVNSGAILEFSITERATNQLVYSIGSPDPIILHGPSFYNKLYSIHDGYMIFRHDVCCNNCAQYSYYLNLNADIIHKYVINQAYMTSEFVTITNPDNDDVIEIENDYMLQKTHYTLLSNRISKKQTLPIISNDLMKPHDTLNRIQNLLIFS